jgi:hypothetical protein
VSTFQLPELVGVETPLMTACQQPVETVRGTEVPVAWFASGVRVIDIANPLAMRQVAWWIPDVPPRATHVCSNDVYEGSARNGARCRCSVWECEAARLRRSVTPDQT